MPGEFFDASGALIPATGGQMPFDFGQWMAQQGQQLKTNVGPLFSGTPQGNAAAGTLLGTIGAAVAPEGSWQQKLAGVGANIGKTAASQLQTKGVGGGATAAPLVNANNKLTQDVVNAPNAPAGSPQTLPQLSAATTNVVNQTGGIPTPGATEASILRRTTGPGPGRMEPGVGTVPAPTAGVPGVTTPPPPAPVPTTAPQTGAPPQNFPVAPAQVPSLEGQVPSAIGQGAGAVSDMDSNLLAIGLGDPKTFQENYKMISDARSKEMQGAAHLGQAFDKFRAGQVDYATEKFGSDMIGLRKGMEVTRLHGEIQDALANNDVARIAARSREYDNMPLNATMQKKFGVSTWGQLMRMNPQAIQAFGAQLQYDATMASVYEQAKGRMDAKDDAMWRATQRDLAAYADKFTPLEWAEMVAKDPKKAQMLLDNYGARGTSPFMTESEFGNYQQSALQMDALSTRLGLPAGHADRIRRMSLENQSRPVLTQAAAENQHKQIANQQRQAEFQLKAEMLRKYGAGVPASMIPPPQTSAIENMQGMAFDSGPQTDAIIDYLRQTDPGFAAEYAERLKQIQSQTVPRR